MPQKIVINNCYGGFSLSHEAVMLYAKKKGITLYAFQNRDASVLGKMIPFEGGKEPCMICYSITPLNEKDEIPNSSYFSIRLMPRDDQALIEVVEELSEKANGRHASLKIIEIPDGPIKWVIEEEDGDEWVAEEHRTWS